VSWYTGDIKSGASEVTAVLTPTTFLTARYTVNDTPYGDIPFGPNLAHDSTSLVTPSHDDLFTGVRSVSDTFADAIQSRRDDVSVKLNRYISGARASHNIRFGVQAARNRSFTQTVTPGGVVYQDQNGAPFQAAFTPVSTDASRYMAYGVWAENEMTFGGRLTITPGVRFDRMTGSSPDAPMIDPTVSIGNGGLCKCVQLPVSQCPASAICRPGRRWRRGSASTTG
jgi:outer membrane receptor protein involved in Fe transport